MLGSYEYPEFPLSRDKYGVRPNEHIPAAVLHQYLTDYAKHFGVFDRIQFNTKLDTVVPDSDDAWILTTSSPKGTETLHTKRLILATGLTSSPNLPSYPGQESFTVPFFHAKDFCAHKGTLSTAKNAVVVGGAKSAFDVASAYKDAGVHVDVVIRPDGNGPLWMAPPFVTPLKKKLEELLHTRLLTWFSPTPWGGEDGFSFARDFLHGTKIGRMLVHTFWYLLSSGVVKDNDYDSPQLVALKPWHSAFWTGSGISILNFDTDFFQSVKEGKVTVHIANVSHLRGNEVFLSTNDSIMTDVVVCATGWKKSPTFDFEKPTMMNPSGLDDADMDRLAEEADRKILTMFPSLKDQPILQKKPRKITPMRLYRFIVPPAFIAKRNIAFAGRVSSVSTSMCAAIQGLWISTYMDGKLKRLPKTTNEAVDEAFLHSQWGKWRYPCGYGASIADFAFDALPYFDLLLHDLGLKSHRKSGPIAEILEPYKPWDYAGLVSEWTSHGAKALF